MSLVPRVRTSVMVRESMHVAAFVLLLCVQSVTCDFCTAYAPLEGSRFTFPQQRCLTQEFMDAEFAKGTFGTESISLATELRNLSYQLDNGDILSFPLALEASWGWESGHTVTAVIDILVREVLGIQTELVCTWGSSHGLRLLGGCSNPMGGDVCVNDDGQPQLTPPLAQASIETWVTTAQEYKDMLLYGSNLGMIGYQSKSGLFFDATIAADAFRDDRLSLEWWQVYTRKQASAYFDSYQSISAAVRNWSEGATEPMCIPGTPAHMALQERGYTCMDGWFFAPSCESDKASCVPVILAEFSWNALSWIEAAVLHGYRFAITWVGAQYSFTFGMRSGMKALFYCPTVTAVCSEKPLAKLFGDEHAPQGRPDYVTGLQKVVWRKLQQVDEQVYNLIRRIDFPTDDLRALMAAYASKMGSGKATDELVQDVACEWVRNQMRVKDTRGIDTGSSVKKWALWIPRTCSPGEAYDEALGMCRKCAVGEGSPDGVKCIPCSEGMFADEVGTAHCKSCSLGSWQDGSDPSRCTDCKVGEQRSENDQGCQACALGYFAPEPGQVACQMCASGSYSNASGSSECIACPAKMITPWEASKDQADCECGPEQYFHCAAGLDLDACTVNLEGVLTSGAECKPCPRGFTCWGGKEVVNGSLRYSQPVVNEGFYATGLEPYRAYRCAEADTFCSGGEAAACSGGRYGLQCHACDPGFHAVAGGPCEECNAFTLLITPAIMLAGFACLALAYRFTNGKRSVVSKIPMFGYISLVSTYTQLVAVLISLSVEWPPAFKALLEILQIFVLDVKLLATGCFTGSAYLASKYVPGVSIPINIGCMLLLMWVMSRLLARASSCVTPMNGDQVMNTYGVMLSGLYVAIVKSTLSIFEGRTNPSAPDTLRAYDGFLIWNEEMLSLLPVAAFGILVYIVGVTSLLTWVVLRAPALYSESSSFKIRFAFLLNRWHPRRWYWGFCFLARNVLCSLVPSVTTDGVMQLLLLIAIVVTSAVAQVRLWPWRESVSNKMDCMFSMALSTILIAGLASVSASTSEVVELTLAVACLASYVLAIAAALLIVAKSTFPEVVKRVYVCCTARSRSRRRTEEGQEDSMRASDGRRPSTVSNDSGVSVCSLDSDGSMESGPSGSPGEVIREKSFIDSILSTRSSRIEESKHQNFFQILRRLQEKFVLVGSEETAGGQHLMATLQTLAGELPQEDVRKLARALRLLGYHALADRDLRPRGIVLAPVILRRDFADESTLNDAISRDASASSNVREAASKSVESEAPAMPTLLCETQADKPKVNGEVCPGPEPVASTDMTQESNVLDVVVGPDPADVTEVRC